VHCFLLLRVERHAPAPPADTLNTRAKRPKSSPVPAQSLRSSMRAGPTRPSVPPTGTGQTYRPTSSWGSRALLVCAMCLSLLRAPQVARASLMAAAMWVTRWCAAATWTLSPAVARASGWAGCHTPFYMNTGSSPGGSAGRPRGRRWCSGKTACGNTANLLARNRWRARPRTDRAPSCHPHRGCHQAHHRELRRALERQIHYTKEKQRELQLQVSR